MGSPFGVAFQQSPEQRFRLIWDTDDHAAILAYEDPIDLPRPLHHLGFKNLAVLFRGFRPFSFQGVGVENKDHVLVILLQHLWFGAGPYLAAPTFFAIGFAATLGCLAGSGCLTTIACFAAAT